MIAIVVTRTEQLVGGVVEIHKDGIGQVTHEGVGCVCQIQAVEPPVDVVNEVRTTLAVEGDSADIDAGDCAHHRGCARRRGMETFDGLVVQNIVDPSIRRVVGYAVNITVFESTRYRLKSPNGLGVVV